MKTCTYCGGKVFNGEKRCSECHKLYQSKNTKPKIQETDPRNGLCHYSDGEDYCPLPGSVKEGGIWLCRWHFRARNDPGLAQQILFDVQRPGGLKRYLSQINSGLSYEAEHKQYMAENDVTRHPGETMKEYQHRMIVGMAKMVNAQGLLKRINE